MLHDAPHLDYLFGRLNYERLGMPGGNADLRIGRMRRLLRALGDPQDGLKVVHIAGTKGKGSTSALIAAALTASGVRTGLFSSPHLHRIEERFQVDGREIAPSELARLVHEIQPVVTQVDSEDSHFDGRGATFFEVTTAIGLLHFARQGVGAVVLEVGMGGRLDSTNAVHPILAVLTTISLDHTRQLGSTLGAIAGEKAGIIKRRSTVVSGVRGDEARAVIDRVAAARFARLHTIDRDFTYQYHPPTPPVDGPTPGRVAVQTWARRWEPTPLPLLGEHQGQNAATALASLDALREGGHFDVGPDAVTRGWASLTWPARVEVMERNPFLVVDGAHNAASAEALAQTLRDHFPPIRWTLVYGGTREKDLIGQVRALAPLAGQVVATRYVENVRAIEPLEVAAAFRNVIRDDPTLAITVHETTTPPEALALARSLTSPERGIVVTGSLFLAAEIRALIRSEVPQPSGEPDR